MRFLETLEGYGKSEQILFGHQNAGHIGVSIERKDGTESDVSRLTGKMPAVVGVDTLSFTGYEGNMQDLIKVVKNLHKEGCLITLSSHMPNFSLGGDKYIDYTPNIIEGDCGHRIMPGGDLNAKYLRFLDMIADFAEECVDVAGNKIPMLLRIFHECNGDWFWWGRAYLTDAEFIELFRYTIDYLMGTKGVTNFAVCYSPNGPAKSEESYMSRYPGDDIVDVLGVDWYHDHPHKGDGFWKRLSQTLDRVASCARQHSKIAAFTECGYRSYSDTPDGKYYEGLAPSGNLVKNWFSDLLRTVMSSEGGRQMAYILFWANFSNIQFWIPYEKDGFRHEFADDFCKFADDPRIVMAPVDAPPTSI